jgi:RimJ/RimL family protein N-acetyltransferase
MTRRSGATVTLAPWRIEHAPELVRLANDVEVSRYLLPGFPSPYRRSDAIDWILAQGHREPTMHFAVEEGHRLVGSVGFELGTSERRGSAFVGYFIGRDFWGRGLATDALRTIVEHAFELPGIYRVWANVMAPNVSSMRVLEKAGFTRDAVIRSAIVDRYGNRHDEHIFALIRP